MTTFVDTGGWISVVVVTDRYHDLGALHFDEIVNRRDRLVTSDYILDETVTRLRYDASHATAVEFLDFIEEAEQRGSVRVLRVDSVVWQAAEKLFRRYDDQALSFTDCTSFVLLAQVGADEVFGFDEHFLMQGVNVRPLW